MKHLMLTTALIAAGAAGAVQAEAHKDATAASPFMAQPGEQSIHASNFIGMRVYAAENSGEMTEAEGAGQEWEDIGEINDVIMSRDGQVNAVLVDIGGFLGIGERQVAAKLSDVQFVSDSSTEDADDFFLVLNADPATLEEAPEFGAEQQASADMSEDGEGSDMAAATGTEASEDGMTDETPMEFAEAETEEMADEAGEEMAEAGNEAEAAMDEAGDEMADAADNAGEAMEETGEDMAQAAENTGEAIEETGEDVAEGAENAAEETGEAVADAAESTEDAVEETGNDIAAAADEANDEMAEAADEATDADAENMAASEETGEPMMGEDMAEADAEAEGDMNGENFSAAGDAVLTAENLDGARVYDANDKWIGEVSDLVVTEEGEITDAIVDVGGFLGLGEKPVALKLSDLKIMQQDGGNELRIYTAMIESDLKEMPRFER
ncbi:MAG: PRC-barrel domain-containing protein [Pseudooceanicola atlanticus]